MAIAPVLKTGARKGLWVRILLPPQIIMPLFNVASELVTLARGSYILKLFLYLTGYNRSFSGYRLDFHVIK